jgi:hypothetical protein
MFTESSRIKIHTRGCIPAFLEQEGRFRGCDCSGKQFNFNIGTYLGSHPSQCDEHEMQSREGEISLNLDEKARHPSQRGGSECQ